MGINCIDYLNWKAFVHDYENDVFRGKGFCKGRFLFRGQANADWQLSSSFDRKYRDLEWNLRSEIEKRMLEEFKNNCERNIHDTGVGTLTDTQIKYMAQHYGIPTRLLDWSYSPFISAYFAFAPTCTSTKVAIWALNTEHEVWNSTYGVEVKKDILTVNERQKRQLGCFTVLNSPEASLDSFITRCEMNGIDISNALMKLIIPANQRKTALLELDAMNINASTIMGGYEGCAFAAMIDTELNLL